MSASQFPPLQSKPSNKHCTNCSSKMLAYTLPGHYSSSVEIDVCMDCNAIWFDQFESIQLSPDGTVALFQLINERGGTATSAATKFGQGLRCVTCGDGMRLVNDTVRNTRFAYQSCEKGHGRMTTFYNFLAEKQFVRELTKAERAKLAATVKQIRCSGCAAPVNIGRVDACEYCRAPVSVFDRDAAKKAIDHYLRERQNQRPATPGNRREAGRASGDQWSAYDRADLGADILYALSRAALRGVGGAGRAVPAAGASGAALAGDGFQALPDATSALFGPEALPGAAAAASGALGDVSASALGDALSGTAGAASDVASGVLPSATDALFGAASSGLGGVGEIAGDAAGSLAGEMASALGGAASSGLAESMSSVAADLGGSAIEAVSGGALDVAGDMASSVGGGVVDLVTDGIGSLLGSLFS